MKKKKENNFLIFQTKKKYKIIFYLIFKLKSPTLFVIFNIYLYNSFVFDFNKLKNCKDDLKNNNENEVIKVIKKLKKIKINENENDFNNNFI